MDNYLSTLKSIESELVAELQKSSLFIKLESLRKTIKDFEVNGPFLPTIGGSLPVNGNSNTSSEYAGIGEKRVLVPSMYDPNKLTWRERVLFIVNKMPLCGIGEIIREVQRLEPSHDRKFLTKRIGVTVSNLKTEGFLDVKTVDGKYKYFIKR